MRTLILIGTALGLGAGLVYRVVRLVAVLPGALLRGQLRTARRRGHHWAHGIGGPDPVPTIEGLGTVRNTTIVK
nr:hypothetical protein JVH1_6617 [Rhodococcus sp. JVH1]